MKKSDQGRVIVLSSRSGQEPSAGGKGGNESDVESVVTTGCGWGRFRPVALAPLAHVWTFMALYLVFSFTHGVQGSYTISVLTTLERRFNMPSFVAGSLVKMSMVGFFFSVVFVSFFFAKKNQPRLFAACMLLTSLCGLLYVIPHFIYGTGNDAIDAAHAQRQIPVNGTEGVRSGAVKLCGNGSDVRGGGGGRGPEEGRDEEGQGCSAAMRLTADQGIAFVMPAMVLFAVSEILLGIAEAPVWSVGFAFIDDHTNPELSAKLIGLVFTARFVSPMISFAMGGYFLSIYANLEETDLTPEHPRWIGAWWLGFLIYSVVNFAIFIPTSMIPRDLRPIRCSTSATASPSHLNTDTGAKEERKEEKQKKEKPEKNGTLEMEEIEAKRKENKPRDEEKADEEQERRKTEGREENKEMFKVEDSEENNANIEEMELKGKKARETVEVMKTDFVHLTTVQDSSSIPSKYLSDWKEMPKAIKRLMTNPIYVLAATAICIDCFIAGFMAFLPKYFEVHFLKTASIANLLGGMIPALFGGCASYVGGLVSGKIKGRDGGVAGLCRFISYLSLVGLLLLVPVMLLSCPEIPHSGHLMKHRLNLTTNCNVNCGCLTDVFDPVCGSDGVSYFSPCHAGCTQQINSTADSNDFRGHLASTIFRTFRCIILE